MIQKRSSIHDQQSLWEMFHGVLFTHIAAYNDDDVRKRKSGPVIFDDANNTSLVLKISSLVEPNSAPRKTELRKQS